jgi:hypothetical protein
MPSELCKAGGYNLQCYPKNDPGVSFSVLVSATGSHRTTGYRAFFIKINDVGGLPTLNFNHERTEQPDLQMMTLFQVPFAFESSTNVSKVNVVDAKGVHVVEVENLPTLIATCPA